MTRKVDSLENVTVIIPTHNRPGFLRLVLKYYLESSSNIQILVLDSSKIPSNSILESSFFENKRVRYVQVPSERVPINKFSLGPTLVETPYALFCADDDFVAVSGIRACVDFLERSSEYVSAQGRSYSYNVLNGFFNSAIQWTTTVYPDQYSHVLENPSERVAKALLNYKSPIFYALHRTEILKDAWRVAQGCVREWGLIETVPYIISILSGKSAFIEVFYAVRSPREISGGGPEGSTMATCYTTELLAEAKLAIQSEMKTRGLDQDFILVSNALDGMAAKAIEKVKLLPLSPNENVIKSTVRSIIKRILPSFLSQRSERIARNSNCWQAFSTECGKIERKAISRLILAEHGKHFF